MPRKEGLMEAKTLAATKILAMTGDSPKGKAADQDFLTLRKHADPDIPILKQAKSKYAKLK